MRPSLRFYACALAICLLLSGCASAPRQSSGSDAITVANAVDDNASQEPPPPPVVPVPSAFPVSAQLKLQAGQHWQTIAQDAARTLATNLQRGQRCGFSNNPCRALHVEEALEETEFSRAFVNSLITALVQQGLVVSQDAEGALALHVDVQSVHFGRGAGLSDALKSLAPGLWTKGDGSAVDAPPGERNEIIVTLSALDGNRYAARSSNVYYIGAADQSLYEQEICSQLRPCFGDKGRKSFTPARKAPVTLIGEPN